MHPKTTPAEAQLASLEIQRKQRHEDMLRLTREKALKDQELRIVQKSHASLSSQCTLLAYEIQQAKLKVDWVPN